MPYLQRVVDTVIGDHLDALGAVVIEGARATGKTSTALQHAASSVRLDRSPELVTLAETEPALVLEGATPRLIDEWQLAPALWNALRHEIDDRGEKGQFLLSGSARPSEDVTRHTGAGRFGRLLMRPMSLAESGASSGTVSLARLAGGEDLTGSRSSLSYKDMAALALRGGWPGVLDASQRAAQLFNTSYLDELLSTELPLATGVRHDPLRVRRLIQAMARNIATEASPAKLASDVNGDGGNTDPGTIRDYLNGLQRVFAIEPLPAWSVRLRSRSRLRTSEKIHLVDPALAGAALGLGPDRLALDPEYFGFVFESMAIRDLRSYALADQGRVYHYRDNTTLEIDAIIEYPDGRWGAVEVKLGEARVADAEKNLLKLAHERVDVGAVGKPAFLMVITAAEYARTLPSGVVVCPLGVLGP